MPAAALTPCREPQCGKPCRGGYCAGHLRSNQSIEKRRGYERHRGSPSKRGYGRRWEKLRLMVLARDPLCAIATLCDGTAPSTDADHVVPRSAGGEDAMENLQGACHACHSYKTATIDTRKAESIGHR